MGKNNLSVKILSTVMGVSLLMPTPIYAANKVYKDETVYVELDSQGQYIDKTSSIWLHSDAPLRKIKDKSSLEEVINVKGDELPEIKNDELNWTTDEKELYYQGNTKKELPIDVTIRYFFNDQEVLPEDIVGESGQLKLEIDIKNTDVRSVTLENGENRNVYTPYLVGTTIILPTDKFDNVELNTGQLVSDASNQIVGFVSLPGLKESLNLADDLIDLPDHLELTADVVDFEMVSITMMAKSRLPEMDDLEFSEEIDDLLDGINQIVEAGQELNDGSKDLAEGQVQLNTGINVLDQGAQQIKMGTTPLTQGSLKLKEGMNSAYSASVEMKKGSDVLAEHSEKLSNAYVVLADGTIEFSQKAQELSQGMNQFGEEIEGLPAASKQLNQGMTRILKNTQNLYKGQAALTSGLEESQTAVTQIKNGKEQETAGIQSLKENIEYLEALTSQLEDSVEKNEILTVLEMQKKATENILESSNQLVGGLDEVGNGLAHAASSSLELSEGSKKINEGQESVAKGLGELEEGTKELPKATAKFDEASKSLTRAAGQIKEKSLEARGAAYQFKSGAFELSQGSGQLSNGLKELGTASGQLNQGINQLSDGVGEFANGSASLKAGSNQLVDGTAIFKEGMSQFYEEGIKKISEEVDNSDLNFNDILEVKNELVQLSKENDSFSGKSEEMEGDLKFIMKTDRVTDNKEQEEIADESESEDSKDDSKGFINWLKSLFNKSFS